MEIIIVGAGQVGASLSETLVNENNDVTVIDTDNFKLQTLQMRLDIRTVLGSGSYPVVLETAGADSADMLIAVSSSDEVNMIACQVAHSLYRTPTKIARIRSPYYFVNKTQLFSAQDMPIDFFISPEQEITEYLYRLVDFPGALQVLDFASGKVQLVALTITESCAVGKTIAEIHQEVAGVEFRVVALYRHNRSINITQSTVVEAGDELFFVTESTNVRRVMQALASRHPPNRRVMIAGGGHIGARFASELQMNYEVKLIDHNAEHAHKVAEALENTTVLFGDAADRSLMLSENIANTDVFCALTNDDEANIMSAMQAKRLGARHVMALITRTNYIDLIEGGEIDIAISPQLITINGILTHIRRGDIVHVYSLRRGAAEAIEVVAHGAKNTSKVVGQELSKIPLPQDTVIGAIVRGDEVLIDQPGLVIEPNDHVILFLNSKKHIHQVEKLFQVSVSYF